MPYPPFSAEPERIVWMTDHYVRAGFRTLLQIIREGRQSGLLPDQDEFVLLQMIIGAATLPYLIHREFALVLERDVFDDAALRRHADAMVATFIAPEAPSRERGDGENERGSR